MRNSRDSKVRKALATFVESSQRKEAVSMPASRYNVIWAATLPDRLHGACNRLHRVRGAGFLRRRGARNSHLLQRAQGAAGAHAEHRGMEGAADEGDEKREWRRIPPGRLTSSRLGLVMRTGRTAAGEGRGEGSSISRRPAIPHGLTLQLMPTPRSITACE